MSKTIERYGKVYEVGKLYEFSDNGEKWIASVLLGKSRKAFKSAIGHRKFIREFSGEIGTIKQVPVKLINGDPYMFDTSHGKYCGLYKFSLDAFVFGDVLVPSSMARNVIKLAPEEK